MRKVNYKDKFREKALDEKRTTLMSICLRNNICEKRANVKNKSEDIDVCNNCKVDSKQLCKVEIIDIFADEVELHRKTIKDKDDEIERLKDELNDLKSSSKSDLPFKRNAFGGCISLSKGQIRHIWALRYDENLSVNKIHTLVGCPYRTVKKVVEIQDVGKLSEKKILEALEDTHYKSIAFKKLGIDVCKQLQKVKRELDNG